MNLLELLLTLAAISAIMFASQRIALIARVPSAVITVFLIGLLAVITKIVAKTPTRSLTFMAGFAISTALLAIGFTYLVGANQPIAMLPVAIGITFLVLQISSARGRKLNSR